MKKIGVFLKSVFDEPEFKQFEKHMFERLPELAGVVFAVCFLFFLGDEFALRNGMRQAALVHNDAAFLGRAGVLTASAFISWMMFTRVHIALRAYAHAGTSIMLMFSLACVLIGSICQYALPPGGPSLLGLRLNQDFDVCWTLFFWSSAVACLITRSAVDVTPAGALARFLIDRVMVAMIYFGTLSMMLAISLRFASLSALILSSCVLTVCYLRFSSRLRTTYRNRTAEPSVQSEIIQIVIKPVSVPMAETANLIEAPPPD